MRKLKRGVVSGLGKMDKSIFIFLLYFLFFIFLLMDVREENDS